MRDLERLGRAIADYFIENSSPKECLILHIDECTYKKCATLAKLSNETTNVLLGGADFCFFDSSNEYECLAIVALEIKLSYDIETSSELIRSYNRRFLKNINGFKSNKDVQIWYEAHQEKVWKQVFELFKKENRRFNIPVPKKGSGRFVQFPKSQRLLSGTQIIDYADYFRSISLEPGRLITYSEFKKLIDWKDSEEPIKRLIFSFYNIWDGRSADEIKKNCSNLKNEIYIKFNEIIEVFINEEKIDLNKSSIPEKFLFSLDYNTFYSTKNGIRFVQDDDYKDWVPFSSKIDFEEEVLIITKQKEIPFCLKKFEETGAIKIRRQGEYSFLVLCSNDRDVYEKCGIPLREKSCFELVGGIKAKRNAYYDFAKPSIKILTQKDSHKETYNEIYIDSTKYPIDTNIVKIPDNIECGKHRVKLWDSTEYVFSIIESEKMVQIPELHGWTFNYETLKCAPADVRKNVIVDGLEVIPDLEFYSKNVPAHKNSNLRAFIVQKDNLENRFSKIQKMNRLGGIYGK